MHRIALSEFADAVFSTTRIHRPFAMLVAYFDESGTHDKSKVTLLGGLIGDTDELSQMERPWSDQLGRLPGVTWYHAAHCDHPAEKSQFDGIPREMRDALTLALSDILCKQQAQVIGTALDRQAWDEHASSKLKARFIDPYYFCFETCLHRISQWSTDYADGEEVTLVFALQEEYQDYAEEILRFYTRVKSNPLPGIGGISFQDPRKLVQLQAADLIAYETYRHAVDNSDDDPLLDRPAIRSFIRNGLAFYNEINGRNSIESLNKWENK